MTSADDFLTYLEVEQRCSAHTVEAYGRDLRQFAEWLCGNNPDAFDARSATVSDVRSWIGSLADNGLSVTSLRRKTQSLRAFYRWGMRKGVFTTNPAADITLAKKRRKLPNFIKEDEIEDILDRETSDFASERSHMVLSLLYSLGLRQAELAGLTDSDVNLSSAEIRVTGKRDKQRVIPLPAELVEEIKRWQEIRDRRYPDQARPRHLIAGPHGGLSKNQLYRIVRDGLQGTSTGRKSPHTLRHSFATSMINHGADLDSVREILGHVSLSTTQIYTHLSFKELLDNYRSGHPRGKTADGGSGKDTGDIGR